MLSDEIRIKCTLYFHLYCKSRCFWRNLHNRQNFTLPPAVTAWTNLTSVLMSRYNTYIRRRNCALRNWGHVLCLTDDNDNEPVTAYPLGYFSSKIVRLFSANFKGPIILAICWISSFIFQHQTSQIYYFNAPTGRSLTTMFRTKYNMPKKHYEWVFEVDNR